MYSFNYVSQNYLSKQGFENKVQCYPVKTSKMYVHFFKLNFQFLPSSLASEGVLSEGGII